MNIIAVDDEKFALQALEQAIREVLPNESLACFRKASEALSYAQETPVDVAFLDIRMAGMNGLVLAKNLKDIYGQTNIIFVTGESGYAANAFSMHASGYLLKPITPDRIADEIEHLRNPIVVKHKRVWVQCFGNFDIWADDVPVSFGRAKAKEVLAYLVDRYGARASKREIAAILWEDELYNRSKQKQLDNIIKDMMNSLAAVGASEIVYKKSGQYAVDVSKISCDYYDYRNGIAAAVNSYFGEYMKNYSWAEFTAGYLENLNGI